MIQAPSQKFISIIVSIGIVAIGIFFVSNINKINNGKVQFGEKKEGGDTKEAIIDKDTDGDGLADWKEALWGTDVNNPDSDGDGISDNDEINLGRNPKIAGPDDAFMEDDLQKRNSFLPNENETKTDTFSREFFASIVALQQSGQLNEDTIAELSDSFAEELFKTTFAPKYSISDIKTSKSITLESLKKYGNDVGLISQKYPSSENELAIVKYVLESDKQNDSDKLTPIILTYSQIEKDLFDIIVPEDVIVYHMDALNATTKIQKALSGMQNIGNDPIGGIISVNIYQQELENILGAAKNLQRYFIRRGVFFDINEPGYTFSIL